ncbi:MAG: RNA polymerase sigma factor [Luteolibacter sp.]
METSDFELMARLADGDDLALNALMDRWGGRVAAFLYKMTGQHEASVDLAQETFVKLYQARERYRASGKFSTYLFAIATNLGRNHARWKSRHPTVSIDATSDDGGSAVPELTDGRLPPGEAAQAAEKFRAVHEAFLLLPPDLREAMSLFVYERMGYAEIAAISGCSVKAVETRIYRARQILKERLGEFFS